VPFSVPEELCEPALPCTVKGRNMAGQRQRLGMRRCLRRELPQVTPLLIDAPVVAGAAVFVQDEPVRLVVQYYDEDPLRVLLALTETEDDEGTVLHAEHLIKVGSRLQELLDLAPGMYAFRHRFNDPWQRRRFRRNAFHELLEAGALLPAWPFPPVPAGTANSERSGTRWTGRCERGRSPE
jgi:hypothetical protein